MVAVAAAARQVTRLKVVRLSQLRLRLLAKRTHSVCGWLSR